MKVLLLHQFFLEEDDPGGSRWNEMAKIWSEKGHEVTVLSGMIHYGAHHKASRYKGKYSMRVQQGLIEVWRCHVSDGYNSNFFGRLLGYFSFVFSSLYVGLFKL